MDDADAGSEPDEVDPRRAMWRRGSYEIAGGWLAPASIALLDRLEAACGASVNGRRLLDVAAGTGTVAIEAARRGAAVVGVDITDELLEIARRRASDAGVDVRFVVGDFDRLDDVFADAEFDVITSAFGVIFAAEPSVTLAGLGRRLAPGGIVAVAGWDPGGVMAVPDSMLELLPERPTMPDMGAWTTGIPTLAETSGFDVVAGFVDDLLISFTSPADAAEQFERWSGGWAQLLETFDGLGAGVDARRRFVDHLTRFSTPLGGGIGLVARYHVGVLRAG